MNKYEIQVATLHFHILLVSAVDENCTSINIRLLQSFRMLDKYMHIYIPNELYRVIILQYVPGVYEY